MREGSISPSSLYAFGVEKENKEGKWVQDFFMLPDGFEGFSSDLSRAKWRNLVRVECLQMVKRMVAGFCSIGGWCYSGQWMWDLSTLAQFQGSEIKTQGQSKISFFGFVWCKLRELGGRVSPRFPCVIPVMESFPSDLLPAISYWTKSHPESCKTARRSSAKIINSLKKSTISARKLHWRCLTGCKMRLWLERCCKCRA